MLEVGNKLKSKRSGHFIIKEIKRKKDKVVIQFVKSGYVKEISFSCLYSRNVLDVYTPTMCGIGYLGEGKFRSTTKQYRLWVKMFHRCYTDEVHCRVPAYIGCSVVKRWHNFQNFCEDVMKMKNWDTPGFELDKDLRVLGNKKYGPKYCSFVPRSINNLLCGLDKIRVRVSSTNRYRAEISKYGKQISLGSFPTKKEAIKAYKQARIAYIKEQANKHKEHLHVDVYRNLTRIHL